MSITSKTRRIEQFIVSRIVSKAISLGYKLSVYDGEDFFIKKSNDIASVMNSMFEVDDECLWLYENDKRIGWIYFVYGNDGDDVIADYNPSLEDFMQEFNDMEFDM